MTDVIRTRNSLKIRWATDIGDLWTVSKKFNLGTRILEDAQIECVGLWTPDEQEHADELAIEIDQTFIRPEDFDRVAISDTYTDDGSPARIWGRGGAKIYISIAKGNK